MEIKIYCGKTHLLRVAEFITVDSDLFHDEVDYVCGQLRTLVHNAEIYGTEFTDEIRTGWGGSVTVTAVPTWHRQHRWTF